MKGSPPPPWADIPVELAGLVLCRLPARVDRARFAAVCPQWRAAARQVRLPPPLPLLALPDGTVYSLPRSEPLRFPACAGYADACGDWLLFSGEDGCFLRNPFSNDTVTLPALSRIRIKYQNPGFRGLGNLDAVDPKDRAVRQVMLCSPHLIAGIFKFPQSRRIAVCRPGAASWWSVWVDCRFRHYDDIAFYQGKLYAYDDHMDVLCAIDIVVDERTGDPSVSGIQQLIRGLCYPENFHIVGCYLKLSTYLVVSRGALLVVVRFTMLCGRRRIMVLQPDFERSQWTRVKAIDDDQVLFLRRRCSKSVCVSQEEMSGDCIVVLENDGEDHWHDESSGSCSIYNMKSGSISSFLPTVSWKRGTVLPAWLFPQN